MGEHSLERCAPEEVGVSSGVIMDMLRTIEDERLEITAMIILVGGKLILDFCKKPYAAENTMLWYSTTKAVTGIGVGIAADKGLFLLDSPIISFFPDKLPTVISENLRTMQVKHLLSMSCGIHENTYGELYPQNDWVKAFLAQDLPHKPGTYYRYSTHASCVLAAIVEKTSGMPFSEFVKQNIFVPLGEDDLSWEVDKQGVTCGGMGLCVTMQAMSKFGVMLLNNGMYGGKQIVSEQYLQEALKEQSDNRSADNNANGYGYHMEIGFNGDYYHPGSFRQLLYISPAHHAVMVISSRSAVKTTDRQIALFHSLFEDAPHKQEEVSPAQLYAYTRQLSYDAPPSGRLGQAGYMDDAVYRCAENALSMESIQFCQTGENAFEMLTTYGDRPESRLCFDGAKPSEGYDCYTKDVQYHMQKYISYAQWQDAATLVLTVLYIETPYVVTYTIRRETQTIHMEYAVNVTFGVRACSIDGIAADRGLPCNQK